MTISFVDINGNPINTHRTSPSFQAKAKPKKDAPESFHRGFRVEGHPPGALERAHKSNTEDWARWTALSPDERIQALKYGRRPPGLWNEEQWRARTKKVAVRTKPYALGTAADECAALATQAGWLDVQVVALAQGVATELWV